MVRRFFNALVVLAVIAASWIVLVHLFTLDSLALQPLADEAVCAGRRAPCRPQLSMFERNALGYSVAYTFPRKATVQCRRQYLFLGDYACVVLSP